MIIVRTIKEMQAISRQWQREGLLVAVVPTMGALHEGHMSLVKEANKRAERTVLTLFINPTQFAPGEDLGNYPKTFENDCKLCEDEGVTAIFFPPADEMYPADSSTWVVEEKVSQGFCGAARPTHFRGVTSVVTKLFNATLPHCAIFGEKDYQQLQVLRRMARDLNMPIEIIGAPIHREESGLAMSSRNRYLSDDDKKRATAIYRSMSAVTDKLNNAQMTLEQARQYIANEIKNAGGELDYIETVNAENLEIVDQCQGIIRCLVAAKFGPARLIDNMEIYRGK